MAHINLGDGAGDRGRLDEAIACLQEGHRARPEDPIARSGRTRSGRPRPGTGSPPTGTAASRPGTTEERLGLAEWCRSRSSIATAAGLYAAAFAADPRLADDLKADHRYNAACFAALAAAGQGEDAAGLDDAERHPPPHARPSTGSAPTWPCVTRQIESADPADRAVR